MALSCRAGGRASGFLKSQAHSADIHFRPTLTRMPERTSINEEVASKYVDQIAVLAILAEGGTNVAVEVLRVVEQAAREFAADETGSVTGNFKWISGQLGFLSDATIEQPWAHTTF